MSRSVFAAFLLAIAALAAPATAVGATPRCFGKPATHVMHIGDPVYIGTSGNDIVVGSAGNDTINLLSGGGVDLLCGGGGDDVIVVSGPQSKADGGPGQDQVYAYAGALARGGGGDDPLVFAEGAGSRAEGGSGDDLVEAQSGATADGGSGNDRVEGFLAVALFGSSGGDTVHNEGGTPKIDCGSAYDSVTPGGATDVRRCENFDYDD